jgi:hypothetical protein
MPRTLPHTATHCRTEPHTLPHTAALLHTTALPHTLALPHSRTLPHHRAAWHCRAHFHTLPSALPHTATRITTHSCVHCLMLQRSRPSCLNSRSSSLSKTKCNKMRLTLIRRLTLIDFYFDYYQGWLFGMWGPPSLLHQTRPIIWCAPNFPCLNLFVHSIIIMDT